MLSYTNHDHPLPIMQGTPPPPEWRLPLLDWDRPPWNRWSFQRIREFLPTAPIPRGGHVRELPEAPRDIGSLVFESRGIPMTVDNLLHHGYCDGFLVIAGGKVVYERYWNGMHRRSVHLLQSVSKSITGVTLGILAGEGLVDLAAPVSAHVPELAHTGWHDATVRHVMDMGSGIRYVEEYEARDSDMGKTDYAAGWKPAPAGVDTSWWPQTLWDQLLSLTEKEAAPGVRFKYASIETEVLAHIIERAAGKRLPQVIAERLWGPMGAEEDASITVDRNGAGTASGGISVSLRDLGRLGLALLEGGEVEGRQVIPEAFVGDLRAGPRLPLDEHGRHYFPNGGYRSQFWIEDMQRDTFVGLGVFGQALYVSPATGVVIAKLASAPAFVDVAQTQDTMAGFRAIAAALA